MEQPFRTPFVTLHHWKLSNVHSSSTFFFIVFFCLVLVSLFSCDIVTLYGALSVVIGLGLGLGLGSAGSRPRPRPRPRPQKSGLDRSRDQDQVSRPTSLAVMCTSHSVMEGQRHNNPLNPRCFVYNGPKGMDMELAPNSRYSGGS